MDIRAGLIFGIALLGPGVARGQALSPLEQGILDNLHELRANPSAYADLLKQWRPWSQGVITKLPDQTDAPTKEVVRALEEAIAELESIRGSLGAITLSPGLSHAAADHIRDTGSRGLTGHTGADGSDFRGRIDRYGAWSGSIAENIVYGLNKPREAVMMQLVDYGVEGRGHRRNLLNPALLYVGIACGPHTTYRIMCVMDFAASYRDATASGGSIRP